MVTNLKETKEAKCKVGGLTHLLQAQSSHLFLPPGWHEAFCAPRQTLIPKRSKFSISGLFVIFCKFQSVRSYFSILTDFGVPIKLQSASQSQKEKGMLRLSPRVNGDVTTFSSCD